MSDDAPGFQTIRSDSRSRKRECRNLATTTVVRCWDWEQDNDVRYHANKSRHHRSLTTHMDVCALVALYVRVFMAVYACGCGYVSVLSVYISLSMPVCLCACPCVCVCLCWFIVPLFWSRLDYCNSLYACLPKTSLSSPVGLELSSQTILIPCSALASDYVSQTVYTYAFVTAVSILKEDLKMMNKIF